MVSVLIMKIKAQVQFSSKILVGPCINSLSAWTEPLWVRGCENILKRTSHGGLSRDSSWVGISGAMAGISWSVVKVHNDQGASLF